MAGALEAGGCDEGVLDLDATDSGLGLVLALARRIFGSDFENYSRFVDGGLRFRTGDQAVLNMAAGYGGVCAEKVQALKFLTDHYGLESEYLLAGPAGGRPPVDRLRELLCTLDFRFAKRHMRYWHHLALLYWLDGEPLVVDATGGCLPFVFSLGGAARRLLDLGEPVRVRMVGEPEDYCYHRVDQDVPLGLLLALECRLDGADMVQVFENELGLYLSERYYVMPLPYRSQAEYGRLRAEYEEYCLRLGCAGMSVPIGLWTARWVAGSPPVVPPLPPRSWVAGTDCLSATTTGWRQSTTLGWWSSTCGVPAGDECPAPASGGVFPGAGSGPGVRVVCWLGYAPFGMRPGLVNGRTSGYGTWHVRWRT